jgi:copper transporter 1
VALGVFYEYLREIQKTLDRRIALSLSDGKGKAQRPRSRSTSGSEGVAEETGLLHGRRVFKAIDPG